MAFGSRAFGQPYFGGATEEFGVPGLAFGRVVVGAADARGRTVARATAKGRSAARFSVSGSTKRSGV